jgi:hypothetical protein
MIPLKEVLGAPDRDHLRRILNASMSGSRAQATFYSKVGEFLRDDTYVDEGAVDALRNLPQEERERVLSELVWRVTCHLDGSITTVQGVNTFPLGKVFSAVQSIEAGRDLFCVVAR